MYKNLQQNAINSGHKQISTRQILETNEKENIIECARFPDDECFLFSTADIVIPEAE